MLAGQAFAISLGRRTRKAVAAFLRGGLDAAGGGRRWRDDRRGGEAAKLVRSDGAVIGARAAIFTLNDPHGARVVESLSGNLVGTGIVPRSAHPDERMRRQLSASFLTWTDSADAEGRSDLYGLQANVVRDMIIFGEGLLIWGADRVTAAPQLRRLHPEQLDRSKNLLLATGGGIVQGVEFDSTGRIVAYWIRPRAPGDALAGMPLASSRLPASEVIHLFRPLFPGQARGLSWFAPVLLSAHELSQLIDAILVRAKVAALHAGFVTEPEGAAPYEGTQKGSTLDVSLEPGAMIVLPPGKSVEFPETPDQGNVVGFADSMLRMIAAGVGVTFEQLTGNYSQTNYSSARAALLEFRRFCESIQHHTIVFQMCRPIWDRFIRWQVLSGTISATTYQRGRADLLAVKWLPPSWPWVDPLKDAQAAILEIDNLLRSRSEAVAERGYDVEALDAEIAADQARADSLGLKRPAPAANTKQSISVTERDAKGRIKSLEREEVSA